MKSPRWLLPVVVLAFAGCANPEVVQVSPGVYQLGRADHGGIFGNKDALKSSVIQDAGAFAERQGKVAIPVSAKEHPVGILGDWASFEYTFKVVDRNDPEVRVPAILVRADSVRSGQFTSLGSKDTYFIAQRVGQEPPAQAGDSGRTTAEKLMELKKLFDAGALTPEEYEAKRKPLLEKL